jgi:hypothetical protein
MDEGEGENDDDDDDDGEGGEGGIDRQPVGINYSAAEKLLQRFGGGGSCASSMVGGSGMLRGVLRAPVQQRGLDGSSPVPSSSSSSSSSLASLSHSPEDHDGYYHPLPNSECIQQWAKERQARVNQAVQQV